MRWLTSRRSHQVGGNGSPQTQGSEAYNSFFQHVLIDSPKSSELIFYLFYGINLHIAKLGKYIPKHIQSYYVGYHCAWQGSTRGAKFPIAAMDWACHS